MKWIVIITCLVLNQLHAQDLHLSLVENSVKVKNDSLYFKCMFQNNGNSTIVFYNAEHGDFDMFGIDNIISRDVKKVIPLPRLLIDIYNKKNELPQHYHSRMDHESTQPVKTMGKYIVLKPKESIACEFRQALWNLELVKGEYKLQLEYFSNKYYKYKFLNAKKKDKRLINSVMFMGVIKSNTVKFYYIPPQTGHQ